MEREENIVRVEGEAVRCEGVTEGKNGEVVRVGCVHENQQSCKDPG